MIVRSIFATDFGIWPRAANVEKPAGEIWASASLKARFANYLVSYDQIVVPTGNLLVLPVLRLWLGEPMFDSLVSNNELVFARYDSWLAYAGNGGLITFKISPGPDSPKINLATSFFAPLDEAISTALATTAPLSNDIRKAELTRLLSDKVAQLPASLFEKLKEDSYADILGSPQLRNLMLMRNRGGDLDRLHGSSPTSVSIFDPRSPAHLVPEIDAVLRTGYENYLLRAAGHLGVTDMTGDGATLSVLRAKGQRLGFEAEGAQALVGMLRVSGIPDIGKAFAAGELSPEKLVDLRRTKEAVALREWLADGALSESAEETLRRYVSAIGATAWIDRLPVKLARFAVAAGWGIAEPISGTLAAAADNFFLSKWLPNKAPKLFMIKAKEALPEQASGLPKPTLPKRKR